ncbi:hypothetical protein A2U01_0032555 [Trifolium medium]|uniref:Uncharacterized protein n=1 Tax=Trifolium medium TaxID=97028 RepID=A0A392PI22_9FABA|nr:hypothetical protein [Trifolium medium]
MGVKPDTRTMDLVSRVILVEQHLCSYFEWRLAFLHSKVGEFPFPGGFQGSMPRCPFCLGRDRGLPNWQQACPRGKASRRDAPDRISSTRSSSSRSASSFISSPSGCSVRRDGSPISTGTTASIPNTSRNGVSPVVECGVVR